MSKKAIETIVYLIALVLMIIRVDFWWWGTKIYPIYGGWITVPMIYQFCIWAVGYVLVLIICKTVWPADEA